MTMNKLLVAFLIAALALAGCTTGAQPGGQATDEPAGEQTQEPATGATEEAEGEAVTLTMGSWRVDDVEQMNRILGAFNAEHPNIQIEFDPTNPPEYNATLRTQLEGGTAPDLFYLRSFATSRQLYEEGFLEPLTGLSGLEENFDEASQAPWAAEDGTPYGVPMIAVSHGIYYNVDLFNELGLAAPDTWEQLLEAAGTIQEAGYTPFANASGDEWTIAEIVFMNLAPNFIGGREGREAYLHGERCFNDENVVAAFQAVADIAPYLPDGQEALTYYDSQQLFLLGEAAMWFGGSWDIPFFESEAPDFEWSVFAVPAPEGTDQEHVTFHLDAGMGINAASEHKEEAKVFLEWMTTSEFAQLLGNELPGFFPIHQEAPPLNNEHAAAFMALNEGRGLDVRWAWPVLLDGTPDGYTLMQNNAIAVINGDMTPQEAADSLQEGLAQWYEPAQTCNP